MAKATKSARFLALAKRGAEVRARFLADELKLLFSAFPHLENAFDPDELPVSFILRVGADREPLAPRKRRRMTAAARKAVSEGMRKSWASRKASGDK